MGNNTQRLDTWGARKVKPCEIALTELEGKGCHFKRSFRHHPPHSPSSGMWKEGGCITQTSFQLWWIPSPEKTGQPDLHLQKIRSSDYNASYLPPVDKSSTEAQKQNRAQSLQLII